MDATLPLSRAAVDRAAHRRAGPVVATAWAESRTRVLLVRDGQVATRPGPEGSTVLDLVAPADIAARPPGGEREGGGPHTPVFLGEDDAAAYLALVLVEGPGADVQPAQPDAQPDAQLAQPDVQPDAQLAQPDVQPDATGSAETLPVLQGRTWSTLRDVGHLLGDRDVDLAATAVALAAWHTRNRRCVRCGRPNRPAEAGWTRRCPHDGTEDYPRTDPAVIMAVTDDADRLLLGHAAHWPSRRFSTLAGFVEPGESAEAAVRREVAEEVAIDIGALEYVASQPWPFPNSLMLAFRARATTTDIRVDAEEITEARWFTRADLRAAVDDGEVLLPMRSSVARFLIESWYGGPLEEAAERGPGEPALGPAR